MANTPKTIVDVVGAVKDYTVNTLQNAEVIEGKNLVDYLHPVSLGSFTKQANGVLQSSGTDTRAANFTFVGVKSDSTTYEAGDTYTVSANTHYTRNITIQEDTVRMIVGHNGASRDFKEILSTPLPAGNYVFSFDMVGADTSTIGGYSFKNVMITVPTEDDVYEPYYIPLKDRLESSSGVPFRFGIDGNGNYGYIKDGADTVTPFKNPTGTKSDTYTTNGTYTPDVTDYATHSVTVAVPSSTPTLDALDCRGVRVIFEPYSKSENISFDWVDVIGHNGSSYVYGRVGGTSTWPDIVVPTHGQQYIYIYWKSDSSNQYWGFKIAAIVPAYCTAVQGQSSGTYSSLPRSYDATVTLANARTIETAHDYTVNEAYCWRIDISSLQTSATASGDGYAKMIYIPTQASTSRTAETAIVPVSETISSAKTYAKGYYSNAWTVTPQGYVPSGTKSDTYNDNGTYNSDVSEYAYHNVTVNVPKTSYECFFLLTPSSTYKVFGLGTYNINSYMLFCLDLDSTSAGQKIKINNLSTSGQWSNIGNNVSYMSGTKDPSDNTLIVSAYSTTASMLFIGYPGDVTTLQ